MGASILEIIVFTVLNISTAFWFGNMIGWCGIIAVSMCRWHQEVKEQSEIAILIGAYIERKKELYDDQG